MSLVAVYGTVIYIHMNEGMTEFFLSALLLARLGRYLVIPKSARTFLGQCCTYGQTSFQASTNGP